MKRVLFLLAVISFSHTAFSQGFFVKRANLRLGANYMFQNGAGYKNLMATGKNSYQGMVFLGYRFDPSAFSSNYVGVFGSLGTTTITSINQMQTDGAIELPLTYTGQKAYIYDLEVGFILDNWFRISAGPGRMSLPIVGGTKNYQYYNGTVGIIIPVGAIDINALTSAQFGGDYNKTTIRASIGAALNFNFLRTRASRKF